MKFTTILVLGAILVLNQLELTTAAACTAPGQVSALTLREDDITNDLYIAWTVPSGNSGCDLSYRVTYTNDAPIAASQTFTTNDAYLVIDSKILVPCSTTTITVTPVGTSDGATSSASAVLSTRSSTEPILRNMKTSCDSIQMTWEGQSYQENMCEVTHFQLFCLSDTHNFTVAKQVTDTMNRTFEISTVLRPDILYTCNGFVFVTLAGFSPESETISIWSSVDNGFGEVTDLTITPAQGKDVTVTWVGPAGFDQCNLKYKVIVGDKQDIVEGLEYTTSVAYCTTTTISVVPVIGAIEGNPQSVDIVLEVPEAFVLGDALKIERNGERFKATWSQLDGFSACPLTYKVYLNDAGAIELSLPEIEFEITEACVEYMIQVVPVIADIEGTPETETVSISVDDGFAEVLDLTIIFAQDKHVTVAWERPTGFDYCNLFYKVTVGGEETIVYELEYTTSVEYCATTTVTVVPAIDGVEGNPQSVDITLEVPEAFVLVDALKIERNGERLKATWSQLDGFSACPVTYKVYLNDGGVIELSLPEIEFEITEACFEYMIQVIPVIAGIEGTPETETVSISVAPGFAQVSDLTITHPQDKHVTVIWERPTGFDYCNLYYKVTVGDEETIVDQLEYTTSVEYCATTTITVVPVIDSVEGNPQSVDIALEVTEAFFLVYALEIERIGEKLKATWSQVDGFSACPLTYKVTLNGADERELSTAEVEYDISEVCVEYTIQVTPVIDGIQGTPISSTEYISVNQEFGGVTDLIITPTNDKFVLVQWTSPADFSQCMMMYIVTIDDNMPIIVDATEYTTSVSEYCESTTVSVVPVIDYVEGIAVSSVVTISPDWIGPVEELITTIEDNVFFATWVKPSGFKRCSLYYSWRISPYSGALAPTELAHNLTNTCPGPDFEFTISARYGDVYGVQMLTTHACP